jgi:hypothetical protein
MYRASLPQALPLSRPLLGRLARDIADLARSRFCALRAWWRHSVAQRRAERELEAAIEMSESTLNDIGAPDWLRARASARREAKLLRLDILRSNYW